MMSKKTGLAAGFVKAAANRSSSGTAATAESRAAFAKTLRKPATLYQQLTKAVVADLRAIPKLGDESNDKLGKLLTQDERKSYLDALIVNTGFSQPVAEAFDQSAFGLPLMGASIYTHMFAGLGNYISQKSGLPVEQAMKVHTYYRTPIVVEELKRMGYSEADIDDIVAKQFFMQYWSGGSGDKHLFNPMVRAFYPTDSHMGCGGTDLGRETEMAAASSYCEGLEGLTQPLRIIHTGDTGPFTDGTMHALQHMIEANERGIKMPILFMVSSNNSAISARLDYGEHQGDDGQYAVERIQERFRQWGDLIAPGTTNWAEDPADGVECIRKSVDNIFETGKPSFCITRFPFRPGGHASDGSPASDDLLVQQFERTKTALVGQFSVAAVPGTSGSELADQIESRFGAIGGAVQHALTGTQILTREEAQELSSPGSKSKYKHEEGKLIDLSVDYLLQKRQKAFAGMGADLYSTAMNDVMDSARETGRAVRYIHQENHHRNKTDTRGGVYGELEKITDANLGNFVGFMPQEAQVVQIGMAMRSVLPKNEAGEEGLVFVKGPHTVFNEHAKDHMKFAAYRHLDSGNKANHIYVFDGGSLAFQDKTKAMCPETGEMKNRDVWLARVGEHHNTPDFSSYAHDANTVVALPFDMNMFVRQLPAMIDLHDHGRMVVCVVPTASFGALHPKLPFDDKHISQSDCLRVAIPGKNKPLNGRKLVVLGYGADVKMVAKELVEQDLEAEMLIFPFNRQSNALTRYLNNLAVSGQETEVLVVDPNPTAAIMAPMVFKTRQKLGYAEQLVFTFCTIDKSFVPYGNGNILLNASDVRTTLMQRGIIPGGKSLDDDVEMPIELRQMEARKTTAVHTDTEERVLFAGAGSESAPMKEVVNAPMDGDGVTVTYNVAVGDVVEVDQLIAEIESDKATIEVNAPSEGVIAELHLEAGKEQDITTDTAVATLMTRDQRTTGEDDMASVKARTSATPVEGSEKSVVSGFVDAHGAQFKKLKQTGDHVEAGDVIAVSEKDGVRQKLTAPTSGQLTSFYIDELDSADDIREAKLFSIDKSIKAASKGALDQAATTPADKGNSQTVALSRAKLAMVQNMTVQGGDTIPFVLQEVVDFNRVATLGKMADVSPIAVLVRCLAEAASETGFNQKLNRNRDSITMFNNVNIGVAVEVEGQLRVAVVHDVLKKSLSEIMTDIRGYASKGAKLSAADQDLSQVCWVVSSMGKHATSAVIPVLPKGCTGIVGVGRTSKNGESTLSLTIDHATLTGMQGAELVRSYVQKLGPA